MAKASELGEVKTRLCPPLPVEDAARLYRSSLLDKKVRGVSSAEPDPGTRRAVPPLEPWYDADTAGDLVRLATGLDERGADLPPRHTRRLPRETGRIFGSSGRI